MAGFSRIKEVVDGIYNEGQSWFSSFRKVPAITTTQGIWFDLSIAPGNPKPNYYATAQYVAAVLDGRYGLFHGSNVTPKRKHLKSLAIGSVNAGVAPATFLLCDYLMYYPLVDMDSTDTQTLDNTVTLPRYMDGKGVQAFLVATNPYVGGAQFFITYTNQDGVTGRVSQVMTSNVIGNIGTIVHSAITNTVGVYGPFITLQPGDTGIRSIQDITFTSPNGGLACLVLVKPIATVINREITAISETCFIKDLPSMPVIQDGAYLNFMCLPNGNAVGQQIYGYMETMWY